MTIKSVTAPTSVLMKRQVAIEIRDWVKGRLLSNRDGATLLGVAPSDLSQIVSLQLAFISLGRLLDIWASVGGKSVLTLIKPEAVDAA